MPTIKLKPSMIELDAVREAAVRIEEDIRRRNLKAGERYLTSTEAGEMLGVSPATASRAMRLLNQNEILVRQRGRGTFVGPGAVPSSRPAMKCIHILMPRVNQRLGLSVDDMIRGIHEALPEAATQVNLFAREDPWPVFEQVLAHTGPAGLGSLVGIGMILAPREMQEVVVRRKAPAVLLGTPLRGSEDLPSLDINHLKMGRLIAEYLMGRGHQRIAILLRERLAPGDIEMIEGMQDCMAEAGLPCSALRILASPMDEGAIARELVGLMSREDGPTGLVSHALTPVENAVKAASEALAMQEGVDFEFVTDLSASYPRSPRCPVRALLEIDEVGELFGSLLAMVAGGERPDPLRNQIDVEADPDFCNHGGNGRFASR